MRFAFMAPLLAVLVFWNGGWRPMAKEVGRAPGRWWGWSTVGFGLFYAPVCWAASFGEGWLVAGLWQVTIVAGTLLFPTGKFPWKTLAFSGLILVGVALLQSGQAMKTDLTTALQVLVLVVAGAIAYPLGNRKIMALAGGRLNTVQRVAAMTLLSLPFWAILALTALLQGQVPSAEQTMQSLLVAVFSGVIATLLFFQATDLVRGDPVRLGAVEATQAGEVLFSLAGEMLLLGALWPDPLSLAGLALVITGMAVHSLYGHKKLANGD